MPLQVEVALCAKAMRTYMQANFKSFINWIDIKSNSFHGDLEAESKVKLDLVLQMRFSAVSM